MSKLYPVVHQNFTTEENKYSVYCKSEHKISRISKLNEKCFNCPYLYGLLQGQGIECAWEDVIQIPFMEIIDPEKELHRVDNLIKRKQIKKN